MTLPASGPISLGQVNNVLRLDSSGNLVAEGNVTAFEGV